MKPDASTWLFGAHLGVVVWDGALWTQEDDGCSSFVSV